jgi:hypothetical protein
LIDAFLTEPNFDLAWDHLMQHDVPNILNTFAIPGQFQVPMTVAIARLKGLFAGFHKAFHLP